MLLGTSPYQVQPTWPVVWSYGLIKNILRRSICHFCTEYTQSRPAHCRRMQGKYLLVSTKALARHLGVTITLQHMSINRSSHLSYSTMQGKTDNDDQDVIQGSLGNGMAYFLHMICMQKCPRPSFQHFQVKLETSPAWNSEEPLQLLCIRILVLYGPMAYTGLKEFPMFFPFLIFAWGRFGKIPDDYSTP